MKAPFSKSVRDVISVRDRRSDNLMMDLMNNKDTHVMDINKDEVLVLERITPYTISNTKSKKTSRKWFNLSSPLKFLLALFG